MHVCFCVCVCVCVNACMLLWVYLHACVYMWACMCVCVFTDIHASCSVYIYILYMHARVCCRENYIGSWELAKQQLLPSAPVFFFFFWIKANPGFKLRWELLMEHFHWSSLQTFMTWFYSRYFRCILLQAFKYPNCSLLVCIILLIGCLSCLNLKGVVLDCGKQSWKNKPDAYRCVTYLVLLCVCVCVCVCACMRE